MLITEPSIVPLSFFLSSRAKHEDLKIGDYEVMLPLIRAPILPLSTNSGYFSLVQQRGRGWSSTLQTPVQKRAAECRWPSTILDEYYWEPCGMKRARVKLKGLSKRVWYGNDECESLGNKLGKWIAIPDGRYSPSAQTAGTTVS
jgi:hypothetical protein